MTNYTLLGGLTPQRFLREYWHKKPLLIRQAIPAFKPLVTRSELFELASRDDVESRLVTNSHGEWELRHGPFKRLPPITRTGWTLLLQGLNLHADAADALLRRFRFVPDARLDDLMVSYATDGGGVGPHFDSYDVFLLQAHGTRRWRIGAQRDLALLDNVPLKILRDFRPEQEFDLEPGDMLYLPPHYAHDGIAAGECMTYSIGFRAPANQELGEAFLQFMADSIELPGRYADPDLQATRRPAEISRQMLDRVESELRKISFSREDIALFLGEYLSEPKPNVFFDAPQRMLTSARFAQLASRRGIVLSPKTRMLYRGKHLFINGESFIADRADRAILAELADSRRLAGAHVAAASDDAREAFHAWYEDGWLVLG